MIKAFGGLRRGSVLAIGAMTAVLAPATVAAAAVTPAAVAAPAPATASPSVQASGTHAFHPRGSYGKADGTAHWGGYVRGSITVTGTVTDYKQITSNTFLYLSWRALGQGYNEQVAGASNGQAASFRRTYHFAGSPGGIQLTVCSQYKGKWKCGVPYRV